MSVLINIIQLKIRAREVMRVSRPSIIKVAAVFIAISLVFGFLSTYIMGGNLTNSDLMQIEEHIRNGRTEHAMEYMLDSLPPNSAYIIDLLIQIVSITLSAGFVIFILNSIRGTGACYGNLLDGFGIFWRVIVLNFLIGLFVFLWSLLLFIPGIIASYRYRLAIYILIDHPEYSPLQCINESKRLMDGHKWELFGLDVSFIGWMLLGAFPVIGWFVEFWNTPYFSTTYALYYEQISGRLGADSGADHGYYGDHSNFG